MGTDFGADFRPTITGYRDAIVQAALDADMFHHMKDNCLTAFPDAGLGFVGNPSYGWLVYYLSPGAMVEGAVDEATSGIPIVGTVVDKVTDVGGSVTGASTCFVRKFPSPITGNVPDLPYIEDEAGVIWDVQTDADTPAEKLEKWESRMDGLADKWGTLPDPTELRNQATRFRDGAEALTSVRDDSQFANDDYEVPVETLANDYALVGLAFDTFHRRYSTGGRLVTHNLREHMMNIGGSIGADGLLTQQVRESVNALLAATPAAMAASAPSDYGLGPIPGLTDIGRSLANPETREDAAVGLFFVVAGAVVGTVATAASGGSALAVLSGLAGTGLTAITGLEGVVSENEAEPPPLTADTPDGVWDNLRDALDTLDRDYATEEGKIDAQARDTLDTLGGVLEEITRTYQLPDLPLLPPMSVTSTQTEISSEHDDIATLRDNDVVMDGIVPDQYAAGEVEGTEGDVNVARTALIAIADIVYQASNKSTVDVAAFSRAGGLGKDPSTMINGAAEELRLRMRNHASLMDDGADDLWSVWQDFQATDGGAAGNLDRITGQLDQGQIDELYGVGDDPVRSREDLAELGARNPG